MRDRTAARRVALAPAVLLSSSALPGADARPFATLEGTEAGQGASGAGQLNHRLVTPSAMGPVTADGIHLGTLLLALDALRVPRAAVFAAAANGALAIPAVFGRFCRFEAAPHSDPHVQP